MEKNKVVNVEEMGGRGEQITHLSIGGRGDAESKVVSFLELQVLYNKCQIGLIYKRKGKYGRAIRARNHRRSGFWASLHLCGCPGRFFPLKCTCRPPTVEAAGIGASPILLQGATGSGSYSSCLHCRQDARTFIAGQEEKRDFDFFLIFL